jgi:HEPN domain-containing protein
MGDPQVFTDTIFGFHAQQAIEKAVKAWLVLYDRSRAPA